MPNRPGRPSDARAYVDAWVVDDRIAVQAVGVENDDVRQAMLRGASDVLLNRRPDPVMRPYDLAARVWMARLELRGDTVTCGYGTLGAEEALLRYTLADLVERAAASLADA